MNAQLSLFAYRIVILLLTPILLLVLFIRSINHKAYRARLAERLGFLPNHFTKNGIVIHAASVGEVLALKPLVTELLALHPTKVITFTTFTPTGSAQVKQHFGDRVQHCYLPIDNPLSTHLFLKKLAPSSLIVMETELWPNLIAQAKSRKVKLQLINGRLSNNSMKSYRKLTWLITPCLKNFDDILCQSQDNQVNFLSLGADDDTTIVSGNLKYDIRLTDQTIAKQAELGGYLQNKRPIWLVASTHPGDEEIILNAFQQALEAQPDLLLILVPRHPERFNDIANLCQQTYQTVRRSEQAPVLAEHQIWLLDSLGELMAAFALADIVTMGGSFSHIGGHNPLEPAFYHKAIIVGPNMSNFKDVMQTMAKNQSIVQLTDDGDYSAQLANHLGYLLKDEERRISLGDNARKVVDENQGALAITLEKIDQYLK